MKKLLQDSVLKSGWSVFLGVIVICLVLIAGCGPRPPQPEKGKPAPAFSLTDTQGKVWSLKELTGKVVLLNFWATWCSPCREEMPSMERLNKLMAGKPFVMLTVVYKDEPANAEKFVRRLGGTFPVLVDRDGSTSKSYGLTGVPETFIIDQQGVLREWFVGAKPWDSQGALEMLAKYVK